MPFCFGENYMQPATNSIERKRHPVWVVIFWAFLALLFASVSIIEMWGTWDLRHKASSLLLPFMLLLGPARVFWNRRSGKEVDFSELAYTGYLAAFAAVLVFAHR